MDTEEPKPERYIRGFGGTWLRCVFCCQAACPEVSGGFEEGRGCLVGYLAAKDLATGQWRGVNVKAEIVVMCELVC